MAEVASNARCAHRLLADLLGEGSCEGQCELVKENWVQCSNIWTSPSIFLVGVRTRLELLPCEAPVHSEHKETVPYIAHTCTRSVHVYTYGCAKMMHLPNGAGAGAGMIRDMRDGKSVLNGGCGKVGGYLSGYQNRHRVQSSHPQVRNKSALICSPGNSRKLGVCMLFPVPSFQASPETCGMSTSASRWIPRLFWYPVGAKDVG
jgi:hypothetical protein